MKEKGEGGEERERTENTSTLKLSEMTSGQTLGEPGRRKADSTGLKFNMKPEYRWFSHTEQCPECSQLRCGSRK